MKKNNNKVKATVNATKSGKRITKSSKSSKDMISNVVSQLPQECFVMSGDKNIYRGSTELPYVEINQRPVLDALGIPYERANIGDRQVYVYWDPNYEIYEERVLPLYFKGPKGGFKTAVKVKGQVPSAEMWNAATKLKEEAILGSGILRYYEQKYCFAKKILHGNPCGVVLTAKIIHEDISWNGTEIKVFSYPVDNKKSLVFFFDKNKIDQMRAEDHKNKVPTCLELIVPAYMDEYKSKIIGKAGARIQFMAKSMKVMGISVKSEAEIAAPSKEE